MSRISRIFIALFFVLAFGLSQVRADGLLVPVRPDLPVRGSWSVKYHHVDIVVRDGVASVTVDQEFVNNASDMIEVEYLFPVPPGAAIDAMTLIVDGQEMSGKLMEAGKARRIYEEIVRKKKDPALMEYAGFGLYRTRAFPLEKGKPARVQVHYDVVLTKNFNLTELSYPLNTEKFSVGRIESVKIRADIKAKHDITSIYSPTHDLQIDRRESGHIVVTYEDKNIIPTTDFQVFYRVASEEISATLITSRPDGNSDGYFLAIMSPGVGPLSFGVPAEAKPMAKDIVIVLDKSGSMGGDKIAQARDSANFVIQRLNSADRFNVITYNNTVDKFFPEMVEANSHNVTATKSNVDRIRSGGGTNIYDALETAMKMFTPDPERGHYLIFLTDGLASSGITDLEKIVANTVSKNTAGVRLFSFGVGYDVNVKLMDKLAIQNNGSSDYVKPNENIESKISSLYRKVRNPVMTNVDVKYPFDVLDIYPRQYRDLFEGDSIIVAGRVAAGDITSGRGELVVSGDYMGQRRDFKFDVDMDFSLDGSHSFVERIWATRRIGWLLDRIQLDGENAELTEELISLSTKYGIITPYTSFLALEETNLARADEVQSFGRQKANALHETVSGAAGQQSAKMRKNLNDYSRVAAAPSLSAGAVMIGNTNTADYEADRAETVSTVRQMANTALYTRGNIQVASNATDVDVKSEKDLAAAKRVKRFSDEYFALTTKNSQQENQLFASQKADQQLLVRLRGQLYLIE